MSLARRLLSGTAQLTVSSGIVTMLSVITIPVLTALLSPQAYGAAALVGTLISLISVIALGGIDMSYARAYHNITPPCGSEVEHFSWRFAIGTAFFAAVTASLVWWFFLARWFDLAVGLAVLLGLGIFLSVCNTMAQVRARLMGRYKAISLALVIGGILSVAVSVSTASWWRQDEIPLLLALLSVPLFCLVMLGTPRLRRLAQPSAIGKKQGVRLIKIGIAGVITAPMYWVLSSSDRWFLAHFHGTETVGVYSVGYGVGVVGRILNSAVSAVWLPEASREYERNSDQAKIALGRLMSRLIAAMGLVWMGVTGIGGDLIRWLVNERFHDAADYVPYLAVGVFFYGVMHLANTGLLLMKRLPLAALWWILGGVVCGLLNLVLVPDFGGFGAAVTQALSFALIGIGIFTTSQRIMPLVLEWRRLGPTLLVITCVGILMSTSWHADPLVSLLMKLPVGLGSSVLVSWLMAPEWLLMGLLQLRRYAS